MSLERNGTSSKGVAMHGLGYLQMEFECPICYGLNCDLVKIDLMGVPCVNV